MKSISFGINFFKLENPGNSGNGILTKGFFGRKGLRTLAVDR